MLGRSARFQAKKELFSFLPSLKTPVVVIPRSYQSTSSFASATSSILPSRSRLHSKPSLSSIVLPPISVSSVALQLRQVPSRAFSVPVRPPVKYVVSEQGEGLTWRMHFKVSTHADSFMSPWHDIPLHNGSLYNYVNEIPKGQRAKMEIATKEKDTPIKQDTKKGQLRFFKYGDLPFNYGCLPQTWEDPNHVTPETGAKGDNDPIDVVEISDQPLPIGAVTPVKLLGIFALIDEGETDWKVLAISKDNPRFDQVNDLSDVEREYPGLIDKIRDWFKNYKTADGKPQNTFAFEERILDQQYATRVVQETNKAWKDLLSGRIAPGELYVPSQKI